MIDLEKFSELSNSEKIALLARIIKELKLKKG